MGQPTLRPLIPPYQDQPTLLHRISIRINPLSVPTPSPHALLPSFLTIGDVMEPSFYDVLAVIFLSFDDRVFDHRLLLIINVVV